MAKKNNTNESKTGKQAKKTEQTSVNDKLGTSARSGKTGATGIIRDTGHNGLVDLKSSGKKAPAKKIAGKTAKASQNGQGAGRKKQPVILITNDDGISAP